MDMTPVPLAGRMGNLRSNAIRELLAITQRPDVISMAGGLPASDAFPVDEIRTVTARLLRDDPTSLLQYSTTEGFPELRGWIAEQAAKSRGREVDADQVLITHGSQQALDLVSKVFVDPGVEVAIDEPGYIGAIQALQVFEPTLLPVPVDEHGIDSVALESLLEAGHRPRVLYTVVNFQNPTGATLSLERRMHLAELAEKYGFVIVEDDPYWALRFAGEQLPSIASWSDNVISLGTFSKLVVPGLRVGYAVAPTWAREHLAKVKQGADLHTSSWGQVLLSALVSERGWLSDHIEALVRVYGTRAKALEDALVARVGEKFAFSRPDGGMFLWGRLSDGRSASDLLPKAVERGMAFVPGEPFYSGPPDVSTLRMSFATASPAELDEGVRRFAAALDA
jgi:2-aminoadipate transaminase